MMRTGVLIGAAAALAGCAAAPHGGQGVVGEPRASCPVAEIMTATDAYMQTFNARDVDAWETTYNFPHVRIAGGEVSVLAAAGARTNDLFDRLASTGWDRSAWAKREIIHCQDGKAHLDTTFVRYRADGSELARFDSLYVMELRDGRWGVTARSSFAP